MAEKTTGVVYYLETPAARLPYKKILIVLLIVSADDMRTLTLSGYLKNWAMME